jgi:hypothetical protein
MSRLRLAAFTLLTTGAALIAQDANELPPPGMTEYWTPQPPVVSAPTDGVPSDAIVLFDGTHLNAWQIKRQDEDGNWQPRPANWVLEDGAMIVPPRAKGGPSSDITSKQSFGDVQLHMEWRAPLPIKGRGQGRGNSGIFFMDRYEVQILDCYENETYVNGMTASVYKQQPPMANACRAPGEWQTYDIIFEAPRFSFDGTLLKKARVTVIHNGVLVQHATELDGPTVYRGLPAYSYHTPRQPLRIQDHNNPVAFRNIWVRELNLP